MDNTSLKNIFQKINDIEISNHPRNNYGLLIGQYRKNKHLKKSSQLQVFTYNNPSKWFWPTIDASKQRAIPQATLLSKIIKYTNNNDINLFMSNLCSGNYFGYNLLKQALPSNNKRTIYLKETQMMNIIENGLFHMGAEDIAREFIEFIQKFSKTGIFTQTTIKFAHKDDFLHKNGCKQFADALTTILMNMHYSIKRN